MKQLTMKEKINGIFNGDIDNPKPLHCNSICRIAYCGYLYNLGHKPKQIEKMTNWKWTTIADRVNKHHSMLKYNPDYRNKYLKLNVI